MFTYLVFSLLVGTTPISQEAGIIKGYPKYEKRHLYRAKGYDPYIYMGTYPFRGVA
tara:strand:+ start:60 stop:227 length:168 start_codon:yes stop_codon:yes gene_type:complete